MKPTNLTTERIRATIQQLPLTMGVAVLNATIISLFLVAVDGEPRALFWLAGVVAIAGLRFWLWAAYRSATPAGLQTVAWARLSVYGALASGIIWGAGSVALLPAPDSHRLLWAFLIGGMCAGAAGTQSAHWPTALAFIIPAGLPLATEFLRQSTASTLTAAALMLVFVCALSVVSLRASAHFADGIRMQLELAHRTRELDEANASLRAEMDEHHATETTLRHVQKLEALGELTGGIAHDFNNLLTAVLVSLELLSRHLPAEDEKASRLLKNAMDGASRGARLTKRLLAFGRRQSLHPERVSLPGLLAEVEDLLRTMLGSGVRLNFKLPDGVADVYVDPSQLELALLNLAANARDAMPNGGEVTIAARDEHRSSQKPDGLQPGRYVALSVADTGEGMDDLTLSRAMEPFFTTKGIGKGTGLGLSMVHGLAAQSGGMLVLRSFKWQGTVAEIWLPHAPDDGPQATPAISTGAMLTRS